MRGLETYRSWGPDHDRWCLGTNGVEWFVWREVDGHAASMDKYYEKGPALVAFMAAVRTSLKLSVEEAIDWVERLEETNRKESQ